MNAYYLQADSLNQMRFLTLRNSKVHGPVPRESLIYIDCQLLIHHDAYLKIFGG